jgi:hypothetical protein
MSVGNRALVQMKGREDKKQTNVLFAGQAKKLCGFLGHLDFVALSVAFHPCCSVHSLQPEMSCECCNVEAIASLATVDLHLQTIEILPFHLAKRLPLLVLSLAQSA